MKNVWRGERCPIGGTQNGKFTVRGGGGVINRHCIPNIMDREIGNTLVNGLPPVKLTQIGQIPKNPPRLPKKNK